MGSRICGRARVAVGLHATGAPLTRCQWSVVMPVARLHRRREDVRIGRSSARYSPLCVIVARHLVRRLLRAVLVCVRRWRRGSRRACNTALPVPRARQRRPVLLLWRRRRGRRARVTVVPTAGRQRAGRRTRMMKGRRRARKLKLIRLPGCPLLRESQRRVEICSRAAQIVISSDAASDCAAVPSFAEVARVADEVTVERAAVVHAAVGVRPHERGRCEMREAVDGDHVAVALRSVTHLPHLQRHVCECGLSVTAECPIRINWRVAE